MINTVEDIKGNQFINNLDTIASEFALHGAYVQYFSHDLQQENIYFVCGREKEAVSDRRLDIDTIINDQKQQPDLFRANIAAFKLTGEDPLLARENFLIYCKNAHLVNRLYSSCDCSIPPVIRVNKLSTLKMLHQNAENPLLPPSTRNGYEHNIKELLNEGSITYKMRTRHTTFPLCYIDKTKVDSIKETQTKKSKEHGNMISLEALTMNATSIETITLKPDTAERVCGLIDCLHPEIVYWKSPMFGEEMQCPDNEGYGSKEENDRRFVRLAFEAPYGPTVYKLAFMCDRAEAFQTDPAQMTATFPETIIMITIPDDDYKQLVASCNAFNAKFCIYNVPDDLKSICVMITQPDPNLLEGVLDHFMRNTRKERYFKTLEERQNEIRIQREIDILNHDKSGRYTVIDYSGSLFAPKDEPDDLPF